MEVVTVVFTNGNIVTFEAQEFDADMAQDPGSLNKYPYKNPRGEDSAIYLKPAEVAGVFRTKGARDSDRSISYVTRHPK